MSHIPPRLPKRAGDFVSRSGEARRPAVSAAARRLAEATMFVAAGVMFAACMVALVWVFALLEAVLP